MTAMANAGRMLVALLLAALLVSCASPAQPIGGKSVPSQGDRDSVVHFGKLDIDRLADMQMRENTQSLRLLMTKLYKRNPRELRKSTSGTVDEMVGWVFEGGHHWRFSKINEAQGVAAIHLALQPEYQGDRVLPFIVGIHTMLVKAHGGKSEFFLTDSIDPQSVYNVARNVEIAAWKLSNARDAAGRPLLLSNEISAGERNLSFEREFGKIVGRLDLFSMVLAERSQRFIARTAQNLATALFLPF